MSSPDYTTKVCSKCKRELPSTSEYFCKHRNGLRPNCKACEQKRVKRYYEENREKELERNKRYREENEDKVRERNKRYHEKNEDKVRARKKRYREENVEKERERDKHYREENPERERERSKRWREANRDKERERCHRRRARLANAEGSHTAADVQLQITTQTDKRGHLRCWWCGKVIKGNDYHVDHRIPLVRGGSNTPNNLCISCPVCNQSKSDKLPHEFNGRLI